MKKVSIAPKTTATAAKKKVTTAPPEKKNAVTEKKVTDKKATSTTAPSKGKKVSATNPPPPPPKEKEEEEQQQQQPAPPQPKIEAYRFTVSQDKGKKAMVRFRENLRKYYAACNLSEGLSVKDEPVLELYCYDPETDIGYCRLASDKHDGPVFSNPRKLYECYNCSSQGHYNDVFVYSDEGDDDAGMELTQFLQTNILTKPTDFPEAYQKAFQEKVDENPLLAAYDDALAAKRKKKADESKRTAKRKAENSKNDVEDESGEGKKKPGRPKSSSTGRKRTKTSAAGNLVPVEFGSVSVDPANYENTTATFSYNRENARLGDLKPDSIERSALCWNIFSHIVTTGNTAFTLEPTEDPESFLKGALLALSEPQGEEGDEVIENEALEQELAEQMGEEEEEEEEEEEVEGQVEEEEEVDEEE